MLNDMTDTMNGQCRRTPSAPPYIEIDEKVGTLRVSDSRLITKNRRAFCRRLVEAVARRAAARKAVVDLALASCRVEFAPGSIDPHIMAGVFADSVGEAYRGLFQGDDTRWWQPSMHWVTLTAYPVPAMCRSGKHSTSSPAGGPMVASADHRLAS
jgi:hypothetical protein